MVEDQKNVNASIENYICENCGGQIKYDIDKEGFYCSSCMSKATIKPEKEYISEYDFNDYLRRERESVAFLDKVEVMCQNCGGEIIFDSHDTSQICTMCGSSQVAAKKQESGIPPEAIIPFKIDNYEAQELFRKWIKSRWFAPNALKKSYQEGRLEGLYVPYWTYDAHTYATYTGRGGVTEYYTDSEGKTKTRVKWYHVRGNITNFFDDVLVCASKTVNNRVKAVEPFNTVSNCETYNSAYLSGFKAQRYQVRADEGFNTAREKMERMLKSLCKEDILCMGRYDLAEVSTINVRYSDVKYKHVLLPIWIANFAYASKNYTYVINGESGKVSGERPYSAVKITIAVLIALIVVGTIATISILSDKEEEEYAYYDDSTQAVVLELDEENINQGYGILDDISNVEEEKAI